MFATTPLRPWPLLTRRALPAALALIALGCTETRDASDDAGTPSCIGTEQCGDGELCYKADCATPARCRKEQACPDIYAPVCGCDGNTFDNACSAARAGVGVASEGPCPAEAACPDLVPEAGTPCATPWMASDPNFGAALAHCTWGDDPRPQCRTKALCIADAWLITEPSSECSTPALSVDCPTPRPTPNTECSDLDQDCWYADGERCWCSPCVNGLEYPICRTAEPPQWACRAPEATCPPRFPQAGAACSTPGASCGPDCELTIVCDSNVWQWKEGQCPICAAPDTPVATPTGERPIASLRVGDLVYSVESNAIVVVPIVRVGSTPVFAHHALKLELSNGATLELSPGHPSADGRTVGELSQGDRLDALHSIVRMARVPYAHERTYDILPSSSSGTYFAAGVLIGSSLLEHSAGPELQSRSR